MRPLRKTHGSDSAATYWDRYFSVVLGTLDSNDLFAVGGRRTFVSEYLPYVYRGTLELVCVDQVRRNRFLLVDALLAFHVELASPVSGRFAPDFDPALQAEVPEWRTYTALDADSRAYFARARDFLTSL